MANGSGSKRKALLSLVILSLVHVDEKYLFLGPWTRTACHRTPVFSTPGYFTGT